MEYAYELLQVACCRSPASVAMASSTTCSRSYDLLQVASSTTTLPAFLPALLLVSLTSYLLYS